MTDTESGSSSNDNIFDTLGSVDKDLLYEVLGDTVEAASENSLRPLRYIAHQLRKEIDRERTKCDTIRGQLRSVDRLLKRLRPHEEGGDAETLSIIAVLHSRSEELHARLTESSLQDKEGRMERLRRTMAGVKLRARVSRAFLEGLRPDVAGSVTDGTRKQIS